MNILLNPSINYIGWGDRLDVLTLGQALYNTYGEPITYYKVNNRFRDFENMVSMFDHPAKLVMAPPLEPYFPHDAKGKEQIKFYEQYGEFPKIKVKDKSNIIKLPDKFVISQFDARQRKRTLSEQEKLRIRKYYKELGYDMVVVGAEATDPLLGEAPSCNENICYAMSKADKYVGVDSGMMHLAKIIMPCENIHVYKNDYDEEPFHSSFLTAVIKAGAKLNWSRQ